MAEGQETGDWTQLTVLNLITGNHGQEKFLQSRALLERQPVQMNSHPIPAQNPDNRTCADNRVNPLRQIHGDPM